MTFVKLFREEERQAYFTRVRRKADARAVCLAATRGDLRHGFAMLRSHPSGPSKRGAGPTKVSPAPLFGGPAQS